MAAESVIFKSDSVAVGVLRSAGENPVSREPHRTANYVLVFPRSPAIVRRTDGRTWIADSTAVNLWNSNQEYWREPLSPEGIAADWFAVQRDIILDVVRFIDPYIDDTPESPFRFTHTRVDSALYLRQRQILNRLMRSDARQPLGIEEAVLETLHRSIAAAYSNWRPGTSYHYEPSLFRRKEIVFRADALLARRFRESLSLTEIARETGSSPFHLCRLFKLHRNTTLHAHCNNLRLRAALEYVLDTKTDLTDVALDLGFSSHSHFTWAFRRRFGTTPLALRQS